MYVLICKMNRRPEVRYSAAGISWGSGACFSSPSFLIPSLTSIALGVSRVAVPCKKKGIGCSLFKGWVLTLYVELGKGTQFCIGN